MIEGPVTRDARRGDEPAIHALVHNVLNEFGLVFDLEGQDRDLVDVNNSYADAGGCFRVVEDQGRMIGCAGLYRLGPHKGELRKMYVRAEARGRGLGRALLTDLLEAARGRGLGRVTLESHSRLTTARALYESVGFVVVPHPHPTVRADIAMELRLR